MPGTHNCDYGRTRGSYTLRRGQARRHHRHRQRTDERPHLTREARERSPDVVTHGYIPCAKAEGARQVARLNGRRKRVGRGSGAVVEVRPPVRREDLPQLVRWSAREIA